MALYKPNELWHSVQTVASELPTCEFVSLRRHKRLREKWCAARFALGYANNIDTCEVEITDSEDYQRVDFWLLTKGLRLPFQLVEVMRDGRRRGDEYRDLSLLEIERRNAAQRDDASSQVARAVRAKVEKYGAQLARSPALNDLHLVLYVNLNAKHVTWAQLSTAIGGDARVVASVWAITHDLVCCLSGGEFWHGRIGWKSIEPSVT